MLNKKYIGTKYRLVHESEALFNFRRLKEVELATPRAEPEGGYNFLKPSKINRAER